MGDDAGAQGCRGARVSRSPDTPVCPSCERVLDRIDHAAILHLVLDDQVYRSAAVNEPGPGQIFGIASETKLRCGYCQAELPREARSYFYQRWEAVLGSSARLSWKEQS